MTAEKTYWNGEECPASIVRVIVGKAEKKTYWFADLAGTEREAVRVSYGSHHFYLDNEDGSGWRKVTVGKGSPSYGHLALDIEKEVSQMIIDLAKPDLTKCEPGTQVRTTKGFLFTKMEDGWRDLESGLTWGPVTKERISWDDAIKKYGDKLPTKEEFEIAEKHGFSEVMKDLQNYWFWSSSPRGSDGAYFFGGYSGYVGYDFRSDTDSNEGVVCVSGPANGRT